MKAILATLIAVVLIAACSGGDEPMPTTAPVPTFTSTPLPILTAAPQPTATGAPAEIILVPTSTPAGTPTEEPTVETKTIEIPVATEAEVAPAATEAPVDEPSNGSPFTCTGGCAEPPDPSCSIKGNVNSKGERIYHTIGDANYNRTDIKPEEGDRWFCTIQEAADAGFRAPRN